MNVAQILREKSVTIISVNENDSVMDAVRLLAQHGLGALLVINDVDDGAELAGILSERDVAKSLPTHGAALLDMPVSSIMTSGVITCRMSDSIASVMELMTSRKIRHLPVMAEGKLSAVISIGDVVKAKIAEAETEAENLKAYIAG